MPDSREAIQKAAGVELGEFLLELAATHKLTEPEMCALLVSELEHTIKFLVASDPSISR